MKVKHMTEDQLKRIIENNYMGDRKTGENFDYVDYKDDIDQRLWELQDKKTTEKYSERCSNGRTYTIVAPEGYFRCYYCGPLGEFKPLSMIKKGTYCTNTATGKCKPCHNKATRSYQLRQAVAMSPHRYNECDDCDLYFAKKRFTKPQTKCPYCGSTNFQSCDYSSSSELKSNSN